MAISEMYLKNTLARCHLASFSKDCNCKTSLVGPGDLWWCLVGSSAFRRALSCFCSLCRSSLGLYPNMVVGCDSCSIRFCSKMYFLNTSHFFREREREGGRGGEKHQCQRETSISCFLYAPEPRHVLWPGIEPSTFCFAGYWPTNWATLVRTAQKYLSSFYGKNI